MMAVVRRDLFAWLRRPRSIVWAGVLQVGLLLYVLVIWPEGRGASVSVDIARLVIYDFFEKLLLLLFLITPVVAASAFAGERDRATLDLLRLTKLSSLSVVLGKLASATGYMLLLLASSLPFIALLLRMGGVSPTSILLLYLLFAVAIVYTALLAMLMSLVFRGTVRAVLATYVALLVINLILPSIQLTLQYVERARAGQQFFWPRLELLYSTPQRDLLHFYLIDLVSPFSVFLNFRFVQLIELQPGALSTIEHLPAGDYTMIYDFLIVSPVLIALLTAACVHRLARLSPRPATHDPGLAGAVWVRRGRTGSVAYVLCGAAIALVFSSFLNGFDSVTVYEPDRYSPGGFRELSASAAPRFQTVVMMWIVGLSVGGATANAIARERERRTLPLLALTRLTAAGYLGRSTGPALRGALLMTLGYAIGVALPYTGGVFGQLPYTIHPSHGVRSVASVVGFGMLMLAAGVLVSSQARSQLSARATITLLLFALWFHWVVSGEPFDRTFAVIGASDFPAWLKGVFYVLAVAKLVLYLVLRYLNPFVWMELWLAQPPSPTGVPRFDRILPELGLRLALVAAIGALFIRATLQRLVARFHFASAE